MSRHLWVLYDARAEGGDTEDACVLETCTSRRSLRSALYWHRREDAVLFEYDLVDGIAENERRIGHLREGLQSLLPRCSRNDQQETEAEAGP